MLLLVQAYPGCPGQIPQSRKMVVCVYATVSHDTPQSVTERVNVVSTSGRDRNKNMLLISNKQTPVMQKDSPWPSGLVLTYPEGCTLSQPSHYCCCAYNLYLSVPDMPHPS